MPAERIVCLTAETTGVLYLLGEQARIVGISGYPTRPAIARREKPKVGAFTSAKIGKILDLQPGPSIITHGLKQIHAIIQQWRARQACNKHWG